MSSNQCKHINHTKQHVTPLRGSLTCISDPLVGGGVWKSRQKSSSTYSIIQKCAYKQFEENTEI